MQKLNKLWFFSSEMLVLASEMQKSGTCRCVVEYLSEDISDKEASNISLGLWGKDLVHLRLN